MYNPVQQGEKKKPAYKIGDRVILKNDNFRKQISEKTGQEVFVIEQIYDQEWYGNKISYRLTGLHFDVSEKTIEPFNFFKVKFKEMREKKNEQNETD